MANNLFSDDIQSQLKQLKQQLKPVTAGSAADAYPQQIKPTLNKLPSKKQIKKQQQLLDANIAIDEDTLLFQQAMAGVKPLTDTNKITPIRKTITKDAALLSKRAAAQGDDKTDHTQPLSDMQALLNPVSGDAYLMYKITSLPNKIFQQLKQGKIRWFDAVDIHGCTVEEARDAVITLLKIAKDNQQTCVKIVHGKGTDAILKTCVNGWLRQIDDVLAFCSAPDNQGGNGSVLVLLKRQTSYTN